MGVITISLDEKYEEKLRQLALKKYGKHKGAISKVLIEALHLLEQNVQTESPEERLMKYAEEGLTSKKFNSKTFRKELYDARV